MTSSDKLHTQIQSYIKKLETFADRLWYAPLIGILAALDNFIIIIPNDGILVASSMLIPKRWVLFAVSITIGSTIGAMALSYAVKAGGLPWVLHYYPDIDNSFMWTWTSNFFDKYGLLVVFAVALSPIMQQPVIILSALAKTPYLELAIVIFVGRLIKFLIMSYLGSHSPQLLKRLWGMKGELKDVGIKIE